MVLPRSGKLAKYSASLVACWVLLKIIIFKYKVWKLEQQCKRSNSVAFLPGAQSLFGLLRVFMNDFERMYDRKIEIFGEVTQGFTNDVQSLTFHAHALNHTKVMFSKSPAITKYILKDNFNNYVKTHILERMLFDLIGNGIFLANHGSVGKGSKSLKIDNFWQFQRKTSSKAFTKNLFRGHVSRALKRHGETVSQQIAAHLAREAGPIALKKPIYSFTLNLIGDIGFGVDFNSMDQLEVFEFSRAFDDVVPNISKRNTTAHTIYRIPILNKFIHSENIVRSCLKKLRGFSSKIIEDRVMHATNEGIDARGDILSLFVKALQAKGNDLSSGEIKRFLHDIVMSFLIAGRDTTACTLSFCIHLLSLKAHRHIQENLVDELRGLNPLEEDFLAPEKAPFLHGVIMESLRLFPPVPTDAKMAVEADVLPDGTHVQPATVITFETYVMGRDPANYESPLKFKPERWEKKEVDEYLFPVFQGGPRICLGKDLAFLEIRSLLFTLFTQYRFQYPAEEEEMLQNEKAIYIPGAAISYKRDLKVNVSKRES